MPFIGPCHLPCGRDPVLITQEVLDEGLLHEYFNEGTDARSLLSGVATQEFSYIFQKVPVSPALIPCPGLLHLAGGRQCGDSKRVISTYHCMPRA